MRRVAIVVLLSVLAGGAGARAMAPSKVTRPGPLTVVRTELALGGAIRLRGAREWSERVVGARPNGARDVEVNMIKEETSLSVLSAKTPTEVPSMLAGKRFVLSFDQTGAVQGVASDLQGDSADLAKKALSTQGTGILSARPAVNGCGPGEDDPGARAAVGVAIEQAIQRRWHWTRDHLKPGPRSEESGEDFASFVIEGVLSNGEREVLKVSGTAIVSRKDCAVRALEASGRPGSVEGAAAPVSGLRLRFLRAPPEG